MEDKKEKMNHLAIQVAILILVPLIGGIFTKCILRSIKFKISIANFISFLVFLVVYYKTLMIVLG